MSAVCETAVGQRRRVDPARQLAQLTRRFVQLFERRVEQRGRLRVARDQVSRQAQVDAERHQPLLCSVVEVPFEPPAFRVSRGDDPRARGAELVNAGAQLGVQPLILECERGRGADCLHEVALLCKVGVVDDRGDPPSFVLDSVAIFPFGAGSICIGRPSAST